MIVYLFLKKINFSKIMSNLPDINFEMIITDLASIKCLWVIP